MTRKKTATLEQVRELAKTMSVAEIAAHLSRNREYIYLLCRTHGITPQTKRVSWTPERKAELTKLVKTHTSRQLAEHFGCRHDAMVATLGRFGLLAKPPSRYQGPDLADLAKRAKTMTVCELAKHYSKTINAIRRALKRAGVRAVDARQGACPLTPKLDAIKADAQHLMLRQLIQKYRVSHHRMRSFINLHGITPKRRAAASVEKKPAKPRSRPRTPRAKPAPRPGHLQLQPNRGAWRPPTPKAEPTIVWPETVRIQHFGYAPHRYSSSVITPATARGTYTGKELQHRSRT